MQLSGERIFLARGKNRCKGPEAEVSLGYWSKIRRSEAGTGEGDEISKAATYLALLSHRVLWISLL